MVSQSEVIIIERLGKFHKILHPGIHFVIPFIDAPHTYNWTIIKTDPSSGRTYRYSLVAARIDLREALYDFPRQNVITKDNVTMQISALLYYQITDPKRAIYEIQNLPESIEKLAQTKLREVIGSLDLDGTLVSRDFINAKLREALEGATDKWGVKVNRVELQEITPPQDIKVAMEKQMRAERDRRAIVLEAEGEKQSAILKAEGDKIARITRAAGEAESKMVIANGEAESKRLLASGEADALQALAKSNPNLDPAKYMLALNYIKALSELTSGKSNKTIIMPYEVTSILGSISTIKELFVSDKNETEE
jgi:regulator of protease activity HflC (stomatin/prohibitin superfamily)